MIRVQNSYPAETDESIRNQVSCRRSRAHHSHVLVSEEGAQGAANSSCSGVYSQSLPPPAPKKKKKANTPPPLPTPLK
jgi:hypothetical protein